MVKRILFVLAAAILIAGCGSTPPPAPVQVVTQPEPENREVLRALSQMEEIKNELKFLRNMVEELQFETENGKRRQQDLYNDLDRRLAPVENFSATNRFWHHDLDRRLAAIERNQRVTPPQTEAVTDGRTDGSAAAADGPAPADDVDNAISEVGQVTVVETPSADAPAPAASIDSSVAADTGTVSLEEQNAYDRAFELLKQSRYEDSISEFQQLIDTWPAGQLADDSYYWMSEARYVNREFEQALSGFKTVVSRYPDSQRLPEALLKIGYIQYDIGAYNEAAGTFRDILARFPGHQVTVSAQTRLRRIEQTIQ